MSENAAANVLEERQKNGKISISKGCLLAGLIICVLLTVLVGLLAGLLGKEYYTCKLKEEPNLFTTNTSSFLFPDQPWNNSRLPNTLVPHHYVVDLQPNIIPDPTDSYWFNGSSEVTFHVMEETKYIILNCKHLKIVHASVNSENNSPVAISKHWISYENQYFIVELSEKMEKNKTYSLQTTFHSEFESGAYGLYRMSYTDSTNHEVWMAASQMQPYYARNVFPCFDEPAFKATFDIYLWHQLPHYGLSNMPVETMETFGDWYRSKFERTPVMSTYLLAFIISDYESVEAFTSGRHKVQTNIYARPDQIKAGNADYAKKITPKILHFYEDFFDVEYPLTKSDQIAIPQLIFGAMENWGLVTYREKFLLYNSTFSSEMNKYQVARVIAHEITHQWFGNLISPVWWNELWLNEGFATFMQYVGVNAIEPSWRMSDQFIIRDFHKAMNVDGLVSSHPIVTTSIDTNAEIFGMFDEISYSKGGCIIRMIKRFLGEDAFRSGLKNYLMENAYGSVDYNELFEHWQHAVDVTPKAINPPGGFASAMKTWILQRGFPVIYIKRHLENPGKVVVRQNRFLLDPLANPILPESLFKYTWAVPFWYLKENDLNTSFQWLNADEELIIDVPEDKYIIGNYEAFGYYRVNYEQDNWRKIILQLRDNFEKINVKSRGQIVDDAFNLARAKHLDYETVFNLTQFLREDYDLIPWQSALDQLKYMTKMFSRSKIFGIYSEYVLHLVGPVYQELGWTEQNDHTKILQQMNIIEVACSFNNSHCISNAKAQFAQWVSNPNNNIISPNHRQTVYCHAVANGGVDEWEFVWKKYLNEREAHEKDALQHALTCTQTNSMIRRLFTFFENQTFISYRNDSKILTHLCNNDYARDMVFNFILEELEFVYNEQIIEACTSSFSTQFELDKIENLNKKYQRQMESRINLFGNAIEQTKKNMQWRIDNENAIQKWLDNAM